MKVNLEKNVNQMISKKKKWMKFALFYHLPKFQFEVITKFKKPS